MVKHCEKLGLLEDDDEATIEDLWSLNIKMLRGQDAKISVSPSTSVHAVKERLSTLKNLTLEQQKLIFRGRVLTDETKLSECQIRDGDTIHLVVRQAFPHNPAPEPPANDEAMREEEAGEQRDGMANILNQLFDDISQQTGVNAAPVFLIDQLRRNLNTWDRDMNRLSTPTSSCVQNNPDSNTTVPFPNPWMHNVTDFRQAVDECEEQIKKHLPQLFDQANRLVNQERPEDATAFGQDMRQAAIGFRRLGKVFNILGRLCCMTRTNNQNNVELQPEQRFAPVWNGGIVAVHTQSSNINVRQRLRVPSAAQNNQNQNQQPQPPPSVNTSVNNIPPSNPSDRPSPLTFRPQQGGHARPRPQRQMPGPRPPPSVNRISSYINLLAGAANPVVARAAAPQGQGNPPQNPLTMFLAATRRVNTRISANQQAQPPPSSNPSQN